MHIWGCIRSLMKILSVIKLYWDLQLLYRAFLQPRFFRKFEIWNFYLLVNFLSVNFLKNEWSHLWWFINIIYDVIDDIDHFVTGYNYGPSQMTWHVWRVLPASHILNEILFGPQKMTHLWRVMLIHHRQS